MTCSFIKRSPFLFALVYVAGTLTSCKKIEAPGNQKSTSSTKDILETAVMTLGGVLDDIQQTGSYDLIGECARTAQCTAPQMYRQISCSQTSNNTQFSGFNKVVLTVNPTSSTEAGVPDCTWSTGETALHTANSTWKSPSLGRLVRTTFNLPTYDGTVVGGGTYVTRVGDSSSIATIRGSHRRSQLLDGDINYETSVKSGDIRVTGSGKRTERSLSTLTGATVTVYHNTLEAKAELTLSDLNWGDATCCMPTSGTIQATYSGSLSGSATYTFSGCGAVSSATESLTLGGCE